MVSSAWCAHGCFQLLMHCPPFRIILFKPFSINMDFVANYAVICVSLFWTVGLFLKYKVSVPSTVGSLLV